MFIIKLGAEALNRLEEKLVVNCNQNVEMNKNVNGNNLYQFKTKPESSILYNLLSRDVNSSSQPQSILYPDYLVSKLEDSLPPRANTISYSSQAYYEPSNIIPRPYSAPHSSICNQNNRKRKQSEMDDLRTTTFSRNCKINFKASDLINLNSPSISCSTDSLGEEPMDLSRTSEIHPKQIHVEDVKAIADSWLLKVVSSINSSNKQFTNSLIELPQNIRLHLLQASWHRLIITYLFEYLSKMSGNFSDDLRKFVQSITGASHQSVLSKKNMSCVYKNLIDDLNVILYQIRKLNLSDVSMNFLRIGLLLTGNHDENNQKNLKLIELFIQSKTDSSEADLQIICDLVDNLLKLNSVIVETIFYGHLNDNVENVIEQLFANS